MKVELIPLQDLRPRISSTDEKRSEDEDYRGSDGDVVEEGEFTLLMSRLPTSRKKRNHPCVVLFIIFAVRCKRL
jgi:hypothetical protein